MKGNNSDTKKGKGGNKTWKNKAKTETNNSKKELAALIKKATVVIKRWAQCYWAREEAQGQVA